MAMTTMMMTTQMRKATMMRKATTQMKKMTMMIMETSMEMRCATTPILTRTTNQLRKSVKLQGMFGWKMVTMTITVSAMILLRTKITMSTKQKRTAWPQVTCGWKRRIMTFPKSMQISSLTHYPSQKKWFVTTSIPILST